MPFVNVKLIKGVFDDSQGLHPASDLNNLLTGGAMGQMSSQFIRPILTLGGCKDRLIAWTGCVIHGLFSGLSPRRCNI